VPDGTRPSERLTLTEASEIARSLLKAVEEWRDSIVDPENWTTS